MAVTFQPYRGHDPEARLRRIEDALTEITQQAQAAPQAAMADQKKTVAITSEAGRLDDLDDVSVDGVVAGSLLSFDGSDWVAVFELDGTTPPTAYLVLRAGTSAVSTAPLKFLPGTNQTAPEQGAVEYDGTELTFVRAAARLKVLLDTLTDGTNIAVGTSSGTKIGTATNQKLGLFNATPVVQRPNTTDLRQAIIDIGILASGGATPLDLNGGALTVGIAAFTGVIGGNSAGSGNALQYKSATVTPPSDADYTLTAAEMSCIILSIATGAWTTGRNIIVPNAAGGVWHISNSTGFTITVKTAAGTGINIANARAAWIRSNGTNCRRITADVDPTV